MTVQSDEEWAASWEKYFHQCNAALDERRTLDCRWLLYTLGHKHFEVLIGEPDSPDNLVLCLVDCHFIAGPVKWPEQRIQLKWYRNQPLSQWHVTLEDEHVGFKAIGTIFRWRVGRDLFNQGSLWVGRGGDDRTNFPTRTQVEDTFRTALHRYYRGMIRYTEFAENVRELMENLPIN